MEGRTEVKPLCFKGGSESTNNVTPSTDPTQHTQPPGIILLEERCYQTQTLLGLSCCCSLGHHQPLRRTTGATTQSRAAPAQHTEVPVILVIFPPSPSPISYI